eukprot:TRINITY_DN47136_c0_g1_i1.p1 TRINITY_DN47136_c0_g1~~TRINITY_DN47136_c0_g1_i1.p1  ORF type:complete len:493 (+),score=122.86 TRINITY_DN47136_c0_g1_i1:106-1584(+)
MLSRLRGCFGSSSGRDAASGDDGAAPRGGYSSGAAPAQPRARPRRGGRRFTRGERVEAHINAGWHQGTVVAVDHAEPWWPRTRVAAYQISLDPPEGHSGQMLCFATKDSEKMVRRGKPITEMSTRELRTYIASASGLSHDGCLEKSELRAKAEEATGVRISEAAKRNARCAEGTRCATVAGLECVFTGTGATRAAEGLEPEPGAPAPELAVVLLHGLGATNDMLFPLCGALEQFHMLKAVRVLWVIPNAPKQAWGVIGHITKRFIPGGQWWEVNLVRLNLEARKGEKGLARLLRDTPRGLPQCRERMAALLSEVRRRSGLPLERIALVGFSQGGITALDAALALPGGSGGSCAGVVMMSGSAMVVDEWHRRLPKHPGLRVLITHGTEDPKLPFATACWARDLLQQGGAQVRLDAHPGGHDIGPPRVFASVACFIASLVRSSAPSAAAAASAAGDAEAAGQGLQPAAEDAEAAEEALLCMPCGIVEEDSGEEG